MFSQGGYQLKLIGWSGWENRNPAKVVRVKRNSFKESHARVLKGVLLREGLWENLCRERCNDLIDIQLKLKLIVTTKSLLAIWKDL